MKRLLSLLLGLCGGALAAIIVVTLFSPVSGDELRENLKEHYDNALEAARKAADERRQELEDELAEMQAK
ncbi:MAG: hypothetical protein AAFN11_18815 [Chloroflexota bacterium]